MSEIVIAAAELRELLPHFSFEDTRDERAMYFHGLMAKAADSLTAIDLLMNSTGAIWPLHCRWIIEAFSVASALNANSETLDQIKATGANIYFLVADVDDTTREDIVAGIHPTRLPHINVLLREFEERMGASETGLLYKIYRLLCEYAHLEFFRTVAYPALGLEAPLELEQRKIVFLRVTVAAALSLPCFAHCPPDCGFDNEHFERIENLRDEAWHKLEAAATEEN
jgi:hypothetical protein